VVLDKTDADTTPAPGSVDQGPRPTPTEPPSVNETMNSILRGEPVSHRRR
jgi:hypothetical protein